MFLDIMKKEDLEALVSQKTLIAFTINSNLVEPNLIYFKLALIEMKIMIGLKENI
jgi:hypothetical protein